MTCLLIARHGNTFGPHETPRRVGCRTDLPLVEKGHEQARALGAFLRAKGLIPDAVFTGTLQRTIQTARTAMREAKAAPPFHVQDFLNEIDYGPDENQTEEALRARVGEEAIKNWDESGLPAPGWPVDPARIAESWQRFGHEIAGTFGNGTVLAVTSNGIARFAPILTGDPASFRRNHSLKISTGAVCILRTQNPDGTLWTVEAWNVRP